MNFYELQTPTTWAAPPTLWSSTAVDEIETCPRRWQLLRSRWGIFDRFPIRPHPAAIEGQLIHDALDRLTRACGQRGNPPFGSPQFRAALVDADFFPGFVRAIEEWQARLLSHPRPGPAFRLRSSAEQLANRAVRMFREHYKHTEWQPAEHATAEPTAIQELLERKRALSEVKLAHPSLPFLGILDRVQCSPKGVEIVDFKTGKPSEKHLVQLQRYALLWWRVTGVMPIRVIAQYLDGLESSPVTEDTLTGVEANLAESIPRLEGALRTRPATARPSDLCQSCPVRARCDEGWARAEAASRDGRGDAELIAVTAAGDYGFLARSRSGVEIPIVYEGTLAGSMPKLVDGQVFRVVDGIWNDRRTQLELKPWSELFVFDSVPRATSRDAPTPGSPSRSADGR